MIGGLSPKALIPRFILKLMGWSFLAVFLNDDDDDDEGDDDGDDGPHVISDDEGFRLVILSMAGSPDEPFPVHLVLFLA